MLAVCVLPELPPANCDGYIGNDGKCYSDACPNGCVVTTTAAGGQYSGSAGQQNVTGVGGSRTRVRPGSSSGGTQTTGTRYKASDNYGDTTQTTDTRYKASDNYGGRLGDDSAGGNSGSTQTANNNYGYGNDGFGTGTQTAGNNYGYGDDSAGWSSDSTQTAGKNCPTGYVPNYYDGGCELPSDGNSDSTVVAGVSETPSGDLKSTCEEWDYEGNCVT